MRLLFLTNSYPPFHLGGYELSCAEMAAWFKSRGHKIRVLTRRSGNEPAEREEGVSRSLWPEADDYFYDPVAFFLKQRSREHANLRVLSSLLEDYRPQVVMVWGMWNLSARLPEFLERAVPGKVVYYLASYWPVEDSQHVQYWRRRARRPWAELLKKPLRALAFRRLKADGHPPALRFERSICCSRYVRQRLVTSGKLPDSTRVIHLCIPVKSYFCERQPFKKGDPLRALFLGRLVPDKGVHIALEAVANLPDEDQKKIHLTLAGSGHPDYEERLRRIVERENLSERVTFTGQQSSVRVRQLLSASDVLLFTSLWPEPFARTVQEAMASGLLVIGARVGGQDEILRHEENALTFEAGNVAQLSHRIRRVIAKRELADRLARAGQTTVTSHFTLDRMGSRLESYLCEMVSGSRPGEEVEVSGSRA